mgnify:CR=1 FL=1
MKQTSVEWLLTKMTHMNYFIGNDLLQAFEQAQKINKREIIDAHMSGYNSMRNSETYYNETFNHIVDTNEMIDVPKPNDVREDDVEKLAKEHAENKGMMAYVNPDKYNSFIAGYNKAKENTYTEEQIEEAFNKGWKSGYDRCIFDSKDIQDSDMKNPIT